MFASPRSSDTSEKDQELLSEYVIADTAGCVKMMSVLYTTENLIRGLLEWYLMEGMREALWSISLWSIAYNIKIPIIISVASHISKIEIGQKKRCRQIYFPP